MPQNQIYKVEQLLKETWNQIGLIEPKENFTSSVMRALRNRPVAFSPVNLLDQLAGSILLRRAASLSMMTAMVVGTMALWMDLTPQAELRRLVFHNSIGSGVFGIF